MDVRVAVDIMKNFPQSGDIETELNDHGFGRQGKVKAMMFRVLDKTCAVYGKGENVRDWLYVEDHARAIDVIFHKGKLGDTYNIGGFNEWKKYRFD